VRTPNVTISGRLFFGLISFIYFAIESVDFTLKDFSGLLHFSGFNGNGVHKT